MTGKFDFKDLEVGNELPELIKHPGNVQLFAFSAATGNSHRIHYDKDYVQKEGYANLLVHGPLQGAFLAQLITDWLGEKGMLNKIVFQIRAPAFVGDTITCKGKITKKYVSNGKNYLDCEIWEEKQTGEVCANGTATLIYF